jgi:hypothetical protein
VSFSDGTDFSPSLKHIIEVWPLLRPHIREAIRTLVDAAMISASAVDAPHTELQK